MASFHGVFSAVFLEGVSCWLGLSFYSVLYTLCGIWGATHLSGPRHLTGWAMLKLGGPCPWPCRQWGLPRKLHLKKTLRVRYIIICRVHHEKRWAGGSTSWNQDFQEKYQQPQICRWYHPYGRKQRRTKEPLDGSEEKSEKVGLKLNIQKTKIMASSPITSCQIDGKTVRDFIFLDSKITGDGDCNHEIKRRLLLGRKVMTNLDSILKSRDITFPTKVCLVKAMVFPVVMYGCESWTVKKAECQRIDAFKLWC